MRSNRVIAALVLGLVLIPALACLGKGPASATLSGPGIDKPITFLEEGSSFDSYRSVNTQLLSLTRLWSGGDPEPVDPPKDPGPAHIVTWVNMGPTTKSIEERTIRQYIYLQAKGGPVIHTPDQPALEGWGGRVIGWFAAPDGLEEAIDDVIAWSATPEAAAMRSETSQGVTSSSSPTDGESTQRWPAALAFGVVIAALIAWRMRQPA